MSKVKCRSIKEGQIPSERVTTLMTADGVEEEVIVGKDSTRGKYLLVWPVETDNQRVLVELPREASSGAWRLWLHRDQLEPAL